jgi:hypothetical protein
VLLHLRDQRPRLVTFGDLDRERRVDLRKPLGKDGVDDDALDLDDPARVVLGHESPDARLRAASLAEVSRRNDG